MDEPSPTQWPDQEQQQQWFALSYLLTRLPAELDAHLQRENGLSHFEYNVLSALSVMPEQTLRMSDLARYTASTLARLSNVVARLERRGWVRRSPDPSDGRFTLASLAPAGQRKVSDTAAGYFAQVQRLFVEPLTAAQRRHVSEAAQRILKIIDPTTPSMDECVPLSQASGDGA